MRIETVLIVDDDPGIRKIAEVSLNRIGKWNVLQADSGLKAIERACALRPDLILLDVMMPEMDGPTTYMMLQQNLATARIPVIFLTAKVQMHEMKVYQQLGACGIISKPFDPISLPAEIMQILETANPPIQVA